MALTEQEQKKVKELRDKGYSTREISGYISGKRINKKSTISEEIRDHVRNSQVNNDQGSLTARIKDIPSDLNEAFGGAVEATQQGFETADQARADVVSGKASPLQGTLRTIGGGLRAGSRVLGEGVIGIGKLFTSPKEEEAIAETVGGIAESIGKTQAAQYLVDKYSQLDPETQKDIQGVLGVTEGLVEIGTLGIATKFSRPLINSALSKVDDALGKTKTKIVSMMPDRTPNTVDELFNEYDAAIKANRTLEINPNIPETARRRAIAEAQAAKLSLSEKAIGLNKDVKKRIQQAGPEKTKEYLDVVVTRNLDDNAPTAFEYGGDQARKATEEMQQLLNDTGSQIGQTRQRYGNLQADIDQVNIIESKLVSELERLNLQVVRGKVQQKPGTVKKLNTTGDLNTIQGMVDEFRIVKQSPTLTNLIDYRNLVQSEINFLKSGREISDVVDPFARGVRKEIANESAKIVGKKEAVALKEYTDFMDAYSDIKSFTDKRAGGEYLLRLALSGRGGEARTIINTIQKHTGKDLMDDAVLMTTVTDMIGNTNQKNLFAQNITKAGLDTARILAGDPTGALPFIGKFVQDRLLDPEKVLQKSSLPAN